MLPAGLFEVLLMTTNGSQVNFGYLQRNTSNERGRVLQRITRHMQHTKDLPPQLPVVALEISLLHQQL